MKQSIVVVNKGGGAGAEGFLEVKGAKGDPHKIIITLSNLFTTPLATGVPFNWRDLTPVSMMALDQFVLWVNADAPYKTAKDFIAAAKAKSGRPGKLKMGGTGSKQEDEIITVALQKQTGSQVHLHSLQGRRRGRDAARRQARRLDGEQPDRGRGAVARRQAAAAVRVRRQALHYKEKVTDKMAWSDIPTCKESGVDVDYVDAARHLHAGRRDRRRSVNYYVELLKKVRETPEWKKFMENGAFNQTALTGKEYRDWVAKEEQRHRELMKEAGFIAK